MQENSTENDLRTERAKKSCGGQSIVVVLLPSERIGFGRIEGGALAESRSGAARTRGRLAARFSLDIDPTLYINRF